MIRKLLKYFRRLVLLSIVIFFALLASSPFYIYEQFNQDIPVARLTFEQTGDYNYLTKLQQGDFCSTEQFMLSGDQFRLDAGFVKWKGLGVLLGFEPRYRLDRLSGRYSDINMQNSQSSFAHNLAPDVLFDFFDENSAEGSSGWLIDTRYGSSVYLNIDPSLSYTVYATEDGLITRAQSPQEFTRVNGQLHIEINQGCGTGPGLLAEVSEELNTLVLSALK